MLTTRIFTRRIALLAATVLAGHALPVFAQASQPTENSVPRTDGVGSTAPAPKDAPPTPADAGTVAATQTADGEIVVTGYRRSLAQSVQAKREATAFTDSIFAEDIGKFPDSNLAESFNRIPGITIAREITGEGLQIAIRGLGTNFTRILLNDAPIAVSSTGRTDAQSTNREVDLDLFPTELFNRLTVNKSSSADTLEGGAAGTVNIRGARPFDNEGTHVSYSVQGLKNTNADKWGGKGSILASTTMGDFGILVGVAAVRNQVRTVGYETIGLTNPNLSAAQCGAATGCNPTGGGNFTIPATVPANAGNGLVTGTPITSAFLLANNPGATISQIDNGLIPRLGRPAAEYGRKDRYNGLLSLEFKPSDDFHVYVDGMYAKKKNDLERIDMNFVGRNGAVIPLNTTYDRTDCTNGCVVTKGTYANAQFFLEYRPFIEDVDYRGINPGLEWRFSDSLKFDVQGNWTRSKFHRESPTVLVITPPSSGVTVQYDNTAGGVPDITTNIDLNSPASFGWNGGRVNIQDERRKTETKGVRGNLTWGHEDFNIKGGAAYDDVSRRIRAFDNSQAFQNAVCGNQPSVFVPSPNSQPPCQGLVLTGTAAAVNAANPAYPAYPGFGTGFTTGQTPPVRYLGSLIPQASLASYLLPSSEGFITVDWDKFKAASNYDAFHDAAPEAGSANTGASGGYVREKTTGAYLLASGNQMIGDNALRFNAGVRFVHTEQTIGGLVSLPDPRNTPAAPAVAPADGGRFPNIVNFVSTDNSYNNWLPSANVAYDIGDKAVARLALSKSMTRPDPNAQLPGVNFSSPSADTGSLGNPALDPFISKNIDLGFEYYTGQEGLIGVAAFRKELTGFTTNGTTTVPFSALSAYGITFDTLTPTQQAAINSRGGPGTATVVLQQQVNASGKLTVNGLEFNWVQPLDFILDRYLGLKGFGFNANATIVDQKGDGAAPAVALGVAKYSYNATAYYENGGVSLRLSTVFNKGSQVSGTNQNGIPAAALYSKDYQQFDFSSIFDLEKIFGIGHGPQLTFDVVNLTKAKQTTYFQFENALFTQYRPGRQYMVGLRGTF